MFPQNYIGAFPYCYRLPVYKQSTYPPAAPAEQMMTHTAGAGSAEHDEALSPQRALMMGQAPGTHWYHAHKHGSTTINVSNGMTGVMIIEGKSYDEAISAYYDPNASKNPVGWTRKQPVLIINQIGVSPNLMTGGPGTGQDKG